MHPSLSHDTLEHADTCEHHYFTDIQVIQWLTKSDYFCSRKCCLIQSNLEIGNCLVSADCSLLPDCYLPNIFMIANLQQDFVD